MDVIVKNRYVMIALLSIFTIGCVVAKEQSITLESAVPSAGNIARVGGGMWFVTSIEIPCSFLRPNTRLVLGYYGKHPSFYPKEGQFYIVCGKKIQPIEELSELQGAVSIRSRSQALEYARLATWPGWRNALRLQESISAVEVMPESQWNNINYGDPDKIEAGDVRPGSNGILPDRMFHALYLPEATCVMSHDGYLIKRRLMVDMYVLFPNKDLRKDYEFFDVTEAVGRDGSYKMLSKKIALSPLDWRFESENPE